MHLKWTIKKITIVICFYLCILVLFRQTKQSHTISNIHWGGQNRSMLTDHSQYVCWKTHTNQWKREKKTPLVLSVSCCNRIPAKKRSGLLAPPLLSVSGAGEPPEPLTCPPRWVHSAPPLRMRYSLKGYTVMALASWSYRGISGREYSVAGSRLTFRQVRWVCWLRLSGPLSFDATGGPAPLRSVSFSACAERATCQVSGLNSSNFQCCAEIEKSPYPPVAVGPTRRTDQEQAEGERCLAILPSFAASTDGSRCFLIHSPAIKLRRDRGTSSPWSGAVTFPVSRCQRLTKFRLAAHFGGSPASKWFEWGGKRSPCASVDRQQLRCRGDRALSFSSFPPLLPSLLLLRHQPLWHRRGTGASPVNATCPRPSCLSNG